MSPPSATDRDHTTPGRALRSVRYRILLASALPLLACAAVGALFLAAHPMKDVHDVLRWSQHAMAVLEVDDAAGHLVDLLHPAAGRADRPERTEYDAQRRRLVDALARSGEAALPDEAGEGRALQATVERLLTLCDEAFASGTPESRDRVNALNDQLLKPLARRRVEEEEQGATVALARARITLSRVFSFAIWVVLPLLVASAVIALLVAARTSRALGKLHAHVLRADAHALDAPVEVGGQDEFGDLARAYAAMLERLRTTLAAREQSEEQAEQRGRLERERMETLLALDRMLDDPLERIEKSIVAHSVRQTASEVGFCGVLDAGGETMITQVWSERAMLDGAVSGAFPEKPMRLPLEGAGLWAEVVRRREAVVVNDYAGPAPGKRGIPAGHVPLRRFLGVPVIDEDVCLGVIAVANKIEEYGEEDVLHLRLLAEGVARVLRRRHDAEALRQSEERYRTLADDMPVYVSAFLPDGTLTYVNPRLAGLAGMRPDELIGRSHFPLATPENLLIMRESLGSMSRENPVKTLEESATAADGSERWLEWTNRAFFDDSGRAVRYQGVGTDITERKRTEGALRASEEKFGSSAESMGGTWPFPRPS